jgi:hypothetical protein
MPLHESHRISRKLLKVATAPKSLKKSRLKKYWIRPGTTELELKDPKMSLLPQLIGEITQGIYAPQNTPSRRNIPRPQFEHLAPV